MSEVLPMYGCRSPIYCFMPDHLHLMVQGLTDDADVLTPARKFKHRAGIKLKVMKSPASFQKSFYDHVIRCSEDWKVQARYIALNPVRAGLVQNYMDYEFTGVVGEDRQSMLEQLFW